MRRTLLLALVMLLAGCGPYRLIRPDEVTVPNYEPREVLVPEKCDTLIRRAAVQGMAGFTEGETRELAFCQQQQVIRAQEEEAVARKLEAHAEAANLALRFTVVAVGALVAVLTWVF